MLLVTAATGKTATVNIDEYRKIIAFLCCVRSEDIQEQTIFTVGIVISFAEFVVVERLLRIFCFITECAWLVGAGAVAGSLVDAVPMCNRYRILPSTGSCITDALECCNAFQSAVGSLYLSAGGSNKFANI